MVSGELRFREGCARDLAKTFEIAERTIHATAVELGLISCDRPPGTSELSARWRRQRDLIEFMADQPDGRYLICERDGEPVGYARVVRMGRTEQLTELMVSPACQGLGIGQALLQDVWPCAQASARRVVVATGAPRDLSLYTAHGLMPLCGHWHMRHSPADYLERRDRDVGANLRIRTLDAETALEAWARLEPPLLDDRRAALHGFFAQSRTSIGLLADDGSVRATCWVGPFGEIGPACAEACADLCDVVLAACDRVAFERHADSLSLICTTHNQLLMRRLRELGFRVYWPSWIMASEPVRGLDRYVPTRPPHLL